MSCDVFFSQLITAEVTRDTPSLVRFSSDDPNLQGITEIRIEFVEVSEPDFTTFKLDLLGCIKGMALIWLAEHDCH